MTIDRDVVKDPRLVATITRGFLQGLIAYNRILMRLRKVPPLYDSGVRYSAERYAGTGVEEARDALACLKAGSGDCEDLCAYRAAELQEQGIDANLKIYWRKVLKRGRAAGVRIYHVQVRLPDGRIEDPSRLLGM
jgi:hypothetical protein